MLITSIQNNFDEILSLLNQLQPQDFVLPHAELSQASIGEHLRHSIELYQSLLNSYEMGVVNYDLRSRSNAIQTQLDTAISSIEELKQNIHKPNKKLQLEQGVDSVNFSIETNYFRELLYNLDHSIHHQALIKVVVAKFPYVILSDTFGVAKSTIEFRLKCAQ